MERRSRQGDQCQGVKRGWRSEDLPPSPGVSTSCSTKSGRLGAHGTSVSVLGVGGVLVVRGVVGREGRPVHPRMVEGTVVFVAAVSLHHEVATYRPLGHV